MNVPGGKYIRTSEIREKTSQSLKGRKLTEKHRRKLSEVRKGRFKGENNSNWKGDKIGYIGLHGWIRKHKPKIENCEICGEKKKLQLANISGEYKRDINDFQWLCAKCHVVKDGTINNLVPFKNPNKETEILRNKEWLFNEYHVLKKPLSKIAEICQCSPQNVQRWMIKHEIKRRTNSESKKIITRLSVE